MINKINKERGRLMNATPNMTQQQESVARSLRGPQTKPGFDVSCCYPKGFLSYALNKIGLKNNKRQ
jgi:hypothetical protein